MNENKPPVPRGIVIQDDPAYRKHQTRTERQTEARELRKKLNIANPESGRLPMGGRMPVVRKQYVHNLIGPVYKPKAFEKFLKDMTVKGRKIPNFYEIQSGPNAGCYREIGNPPYKLVHHY